MNLPNIQTSLAVVNLLKLIDSGAIHLMGSLPLEAGKTQNTHVANKCSNSYIQITFIRVFIFFGRGGGRGVLLIFFWE